MLDDDCQPIMCLDAMPAREQPLPPRGLLVLRRWVVATSVGPLRSVYLGVYALLTRLVAHGLARLPGVAAVYSYGSSGRGETIPGISDIDLDVFTWPAGVGPGGLCNHRLIEQSRWYRWLARRTRLFEEGAEVFDLGDAAEMLHIHLYWRWVLSMAQQSAALIRGEDVLASLPTLSNDERREAACARANWWWRQFALVLLQQPEPAEDVITANSVCWRAAADVVAAVGAARGAPIRTRRAGVLEAERGRLPPDERDVVDRLIAHRGQRFLRHDSGIVDDTFRFLLAYLERHYASFDETPLGAVTGAPRVRIDCDPAERQLSPAATAHAEALLAHVQAEWGERLRGAYLPSTVAFALDELLLCLEVDPERLPTVAEVIALNQLHAAAAPRIRQDVHLFLLLPHAAYRIGWRDTRTLGWRNIMPARCLPDAFALLQRPEFARIDGGYRPAIAAAWTALADHLAWSQKLRRRQFVAHLAEGGWDAASFHRAFWMCAQLIVLERGQARGEAIYALTVPAIRRELDALGLALPAELAPLVEDQAAASPGEAVDLQQLIAPALAYLERIDPGGADFHTALARRGQAKHAAAAQR